MSPLRLVLVIVLSGIFTVALIEGRWYQSGLIFYDVATKNTLLPPTVTVHRGRSLTFAGIPLLSKLGLPCTCKGVRCGCCAGVQVREYNFDQKMCANITYVPTRSEALLEVFLNEKSRARFGISSRNPSPVCVPIMMPIPMAACIQMSDVGIKNDKLHMCMDFVMRLHATDAMELHFNCLAMGFDGVEYLDKNGSPVFPPNDRTFSQNDDPDEGDYGEDNDDNDAVDDGDVSNTDEDDDSAVDGNEESDHAEKNNSKAVHVDSDENGSLEDSESNESAEQTNYYDYKGSNEDDVRLNEISQDSSKTNQATKTRQSEDELFKNVINVYETV